MSDYEISETDIDTALRYLKYHDPENANREKAIAMLQDLQGGFHGMAHNNPEQLLELQKEIDKDKQPPQADSQAA